VRALIQYRPFRNNDAPLLAEIWRSQAGQRGLMQPMSPAIFEDRVLNKAIFDRLGLILAVEDGRPVGFVHAGFGSLGDESAPSTELGVISMVMLHAPSNVAQVADELLRRAEDYLRQRGGKAIIAGGVHPADPFYLGLYGGSAMTGILQTDVAARQLFSTHGYREIKRYVVLQRELAHFRPTVDRQQMQIRRRIDFLTREDPRPKTWWDACTYGSFDRTVFELQPRGGGQPVAHVTFWDMEPLAASWGVHAAGLVGLSVDVDQRRQGLGTYLLGEALRHLHSAGFALVEVHVGEDNITALALFGKLGFEPVDQTIVYRKDFDSPVT
jgi:GNAT superfamily N-acetyltransferase